MGLGIRSSGSTSWHRDNSILCVNVTSEKHKMPHNAIYYTYWWKEKRVQLQIISKTSAKNQSLVGAGDFRNESSVGACVKEGD